MSVLSVADCHVALDAAEIVRSVSFDVGSGTFLGLIGPNGCGKTTLLRATAGIIDFEGDIRIDGRPVADWSDLGRARRLAFVRQAPSPTFDFTVEEFVLLGRTTYTVAHDLELAARYADRLLVMSDGRGSRGGPDVAERRALPADASRLGNARPGCV